MRVQAQDLSESAVLSMLAGSEFNGALNVTVTGVVTKCPCS